MKDIKTAVIPVAGFGTRMLPATKAIPKCMLPVYDKPIIQYLVEEAAQVGCTRVVIVCNPSQSVIQEHFRRNYTLEGVLEKAGKVNELNACMEISTLAEILFVYQYQPLGLGHAVSLARDYVDNSPFLVLYGDDLIVADPSSCAQLVAAFHRYGRPCVCTREVPTEAVSRASSLKLCEIEENYYLVTDMVEKPDNAHRFSNYSVIGRTLLTPEIFPLLDRGLSGAAGEIQLTDAMAEYARKMGGMTAVDFVGDYYDMGNKFQALRAQVECGLRTPAIKAEFLEYLKRRLSD